MTSVFIVGISDVESNHIVSIHETYDGALKVWNIEREKLIKEFKKMKFYYVSHGHSHQYDSGWNKYIDALQCRNPKTIDNYPQETPYITEFEVLP